MSSRKRGTAFDSDADKSKRRSSGRFRKSADKGDVKYQDSQLKAVEDYEKETNCMGKEGNENNGKEKTCTNKVLKNNGKEKTCTNKVLENNGKEKTSTDKVLENNGKEKTCTNKVLENNGKEKTCTNKVLENSVQKEGENLNANSDSSNISDKLDCSKKRTNEGDDRPPVKRKKKFGPFRKPPKNALMQLNELKPNLKYVLESEEGPSHNRIFVLSVEVNGEKYIGKGHSKQLAKHAAAESALKSFIQFHDMSDAFKTLSREAALVDFTDDSLEIDNTVFTPYQHSASVKDIHASDASLVLQNKFNNKLRKLLTEADKKNPVMLLNELRPGLVYVLAKENPSCTAQRFVMNVSMDGKVYEGAGQSKKCAKAAVARAILSQQYQINLNVSLSQLSESDMEIFDFPQSLADKIGKLVHNTIDTMCGEIECPKWKVLAGIVMTKDEAMEDMQIICVATGTRNLRAENVSLIGAVLNDCHAEILARRCLKDFLFTQLELYGSGKGDQSIFERVGDRFKLKSNYKFHFYNNVAPCGDASTFSVHEDNFTNLCIEPQIHGSGILRTKLESGSGTIPVQSIKNEQKTDDIAGQQARYQIMSCTDKITTWNILGIQGSLLNYFIEPIYLHSIVLGRFFQRSHMIYSMFKRIENAVDGLPDSFSLHKPKMACTSTLATRQLVQPPKMSINWTYGLENPELVIADTGKSIDGSMSRLTKRSFFQRFCKLYNAFLKAPTLSSSNFYGTTKQSSPSYQQAKDIVMKAFALNALGIWKKKPEEQELFSLSV